MDSRNKRARLSNLPELLLVNIISNLPFKQAVMTSSIAKGWKDLHRGTTNVSFIESEFVKSSVSTTEESIRDHRVSFVRFIVDWASKFSGEVIESFHLCLSKPVEFEAEIKYLIEFAISKNVKNLILDFSDLACKARKQAVLFQLPECVYNQTTIESLKLFGCGLDSLKFSKPCSFKKLCFGWTDLGKIMALLSKSPLLESLTMQNCWNVGLEAITGYNNRLKELIFENCYFAMEYSFLDLPNIQIFKYSGSFHLFQFLRVNRIMKEAYLDFGAETDKDQELGTILCDLLYDLMSARKLTLCPYLIKAIRESDDPVRLKASMETRHLVIKTNLIPNEFVGIRLVINSCPDLETLTFQMLPPIPAPRTSPGFDRNEFWTYAITHECLKKTLKVVEVRNFTGVTHEMIILKYLIQWGRVLESVDLYLPLVTSVRKKTSARAVIKKLREETEVSSDRLLLRLHDC